ncbi:CbiX/SirB N-terminal domain-containing protein [uncultured Shimia sp.]|uniref:sirohydrochlorin chelatase n=1 Tax=uncultured Shimia sp. TaxID=573152 RepID=UPI00261B1B6B|nr:CbiX/SirB N-terminal domain-containing protein [uncultured Shimia sp.]
MTQFDALIVAHGQPSAPEEAEASLETFLAELESRISGISIGSATLAAPGTLEEKLAQLRPNGAIYPLFMTDGWFVKTNLAKRLGDASVTMMSPFGMTEGLAARTAEAIKTCCGFGKGPLLVVAHGSASGRIAPAQVPLEFTRQLQDALDGYPVQLGFIEQEPLLTDVAQAAPEAAMCLPFFAMEGEHVRKDVRKALDTAGFTGDLLPSISYLPGMHEVISESILAEIAKLDAKNAA